MHVCTCMYVCAHVYVCMHMCVYVYVHVCICVCVNAVDVSVGFSSVFFVVSLLCINPLENQHRSVVHCKKGDVHTFSF